MLKYALLTVPVLGLLALTVPTQAAAPGLAAAIPGSTKANSPDGIVLVQGTSAISPRSSGGNVKQGNQRNQATSATSAIGRNVRQGNRGVVRVAPPRTVYRSGGNHRGTRLVWGGLPFYFYDGYYHGDCSWLRRRAKETGSPYWWSRYRQCRSD